MTTYELFLQDHAGSYIPADADVIIAEAQRRLARQFARGNALTSPDAAKTALQLRMAPYEREVFACLYLDNQHRVLDFAELFFGTLDAAAVYPREVARAALKLNAAAVIFAHNHPSGVAEPSEADKTMTRSLKNALALFDVRVLDHFVIGGEAVYSFAEHGLL
jgi:DNA repair protein RadC